MSILNRTIVVFALVIIKLSIGDAAPVNGHRPQEPEPPYPYHEQEVFFMNEKHQVRLAGTLTLPYSKGPFPAVVLITGSGPHDRNEAVLAVNGDRDIQVPAKENLEAIRQALESGGNKDYTVRKLLNLNHLFQTAETGAISEYEQIEETLSVLALDTVSNWILKHTRGDQLDTERA